MAVAWTIAIGGGGQVSLASLGIESCQVTFRTQAVSELELEIGQDFDASEIFSHGAAVVLYRAGTRFFQGKVARRPRVAEEGSEARTVLVLDAWDELERTVYQEVWAYTGSNTVDLPRAILGLDSSNSSITTAEQVEAAVDYAAGAGCGIQSGSFPTGISLWPTEVVNITVAEVIRQTMRFHPNWVLWIDHSTATPTLNVTEQSAATVRSWAVDGTDGIESFLVRPVDERVPESVRIVYEATQQVDGAASRNVQIDKYPEDGEDAGPGVLSAVIPLQGAKIQTQAQRIETRDLPTDQASAKTWLKLKWPDLADIADAHYNVTTFSKRLVPEGTQPDDINDQLDRLAVAAVTDLPRELVRGSVENWMQVKVAEVAIVVKLEEAAGITAEERDKLPKGRRVIYVTGTTATTKVYKGIASFTPADEAPTGIAQAVYEALDATEYEGSLTIAAEDVTGDRLHGCAVNLTAGRAEWATMKALVSEVVHDIGSGTTRLSFGPPGYLSPQDWMELQRALRKRTPDWTFNRDTDEPETSGEIVGPYDTPKTDTVPSEDAGDHPWKVTTNGDATVAVAKGKVGWWEPQTTPGSGTHEPFVHQYHKQAATSSVTVTGTGFIIFAYNANKALVGVNTQLGPDHATFSIGKYSSSPSVRFSSDPTAETEDIVLVLAEVSLDGSSNAQVDEQILTHNPIVHLSYSEGQHA